MYPPIQQKDIYIIMRSIDRIGNDTDTPCAHLRYGSKWIKYFLGIPYEENIKLLKCVYGER